MSKRDDLALKIVKTVPKTRLIAASLFIIRERRKRAGLGEEFAMEGEDVEALVTDVIHEASIQQLKILRDLALSLEEEIERLH